MDLRFEREIISDLPELIAEDLRFEREIISDFPELIAEDFRFERESISDLPELIAEDLRFEREIISDFPKLIAEEPISELPGERILKCLKFRKDRWTFKQEHRIFALEECELNNSDSIPIHLLLMEFFDGGQLFKEKVHVKYVD